MRVLHAPTTVGGNPPALSGAEKILGLDSYCVAITQNYLNFKVDLTLSDGNKALSYFRRLWWTFFGILKFDVIHYNFGSSFFPSGTNEAKSPLLKFLKLFFSPFELLDVKLAHISRKVIFVTYQGDDARQGDYCKKNYKIHFVNEVEAGYYTEETDKTKRKKIQIFDKYADAIYALNPDLLNVLPSRARFLPYAIVDLKDWSFLGTQKGSSFVPHVIHAPTHREVKGTKYILSAVERLKNEGLQFDFTLVSGLENKEARKIYEKADILIDQLLAGFYGGLSVELMALGKPVICYLREEDLIHLPEEMRLELPIINAEPDTVYNVLKSIIIDKKSELHELGMRSRKFVENWHDPLKIAGNLKDAYEYHLNKTEGN